MKSLSRDEESHITGAAFVNNSNTGLKINPKVNARAQEQSREQVFIRSEFIREKEKVRRGEKEKERWRGVWRERETEREI